VRVVTPVRDIVFLLDVDNTLLDGDRIVADFTRHLESELGIRAAHRFWEIFAALREELGYVDFLGALQRCRIDDTVGGEGGSGLLQVAGFLLDYPFEDRLYPRALEVVERLNSLGATVILSDGDVVLQPRKIVRAGLWAAVSGRVLVCAHKERRLDVVERLHPARHYVMIDDKLSLLTCMKLALGDRLTTVLPRQGHYALDAGEIASYPAADVSIASIGDLVDQDIRPLLGSLVVRGRGARPTGGPGQGRG
jgi:FMN phosphatase YigB (HAD superfamily)